MQQNIRIGFRGDDYIFVFCHLVQSKLSWCMMLLLVADLVFSRSKLTSLLFLNEKICKRRKHHILKLFLFYKNFISKIWLVIYIYHYLYLLKRS